MGENSIIGLKIGEAQLRSESNVTARLASCSSCSAGVKGSNPVAINIANLRMRLTIIMKIAKDWNPSPPWRKVYDTGVAYTTTAKAKGGLQRGITGDYTTAKEQIKVWFQNTTGSSLDDAAAEDILNQLFRQAQQKEDQLIASAKACLDSRSENYHPPLSEDFNEIFRKLCASEDWDLGLGSTIRHLNVDFNIAIKPAICDMCESDTKKGAVRLKVGQACAYYDVEWTDNGGFQVYVSDYIEPPKGNVNHDYFANTAWTRLDSPITYAQWENAPLKDDIIQAALESRNTPGAIIPVQGGIQADLDGFMKVKLITDLSDDPQTYMSASVGFIIGGDSSFIDDNGNFKLPYIEGIILGVNLGRPDTIAGNVQGLYSFLSQILNPRPPQLIGLGDSIDNMYQNVAKTPDGTVGNTIPTLGGSANLSSRTDAGTVSNGSNFSASQGRSQISPPGSLTTPSDPRRRQ